MQKYVATFPSGHRPLWLFASRAWAHPHPKLQLFTGPQQTELPALPGDESRLLGPGSLLPGTAFFLTVHGTNQASKATDGEAPGQSC